MAPSFFSLFGGRRRGDGEDGNDAPKTSDRPARPRPGARVPRFDAPHQPVAEEDLREDVREEFHEESPRPTARRTTSGSMSVRLADLDSQDPPGQSDDGETVPPQADAGDAGRDSGIAQAEAQSARAEAEPAASESSRVRAVHELWQQWTDELRALGAVSTLADLSLLGDAILDLSHAHPGGIAGLYAGRRTQLRNLIRENDALAEARHRARVVQVAGEELTQRFGIAPTFLAVGVATWAVQPGRALPGVASGDHVARRAKPDAATPLAAQFALTDLAPHLTNPESRQRSAARSLGTLHGTAGSTMLHVPVLLRPVRIFPQEGAAQDVDLQIEPSIEINPVLIAALREHGVEVDLTAIAHTGFGGSGFAPRQSLEALYELAAPVLPQFELNEDIVVGTFLDPGQVVLDDLAAVRYRLPDSDVLAAVAGDGAAREALREASLPERIEADRDPALERGAGDLDPTEQHALDAVAAGHSLMIDAPVGSQPDRLTAAILADAAASGRRTVYLPASRRLGRATLDRLTALGLEDIVLHLEAETGWQARAATQLRRSVATREMDLDVEAIGARRAELGDVRDRLTRYIDRLHTTREPWGASVYDVMQQLARLSAASPPPLTSVRLPVEVLERLRGETAQEMKNSLTRAAHLGAFSVGPDDTRWYGALVRSENDAADALTRAQRLAEDTLPALREHMQRAADQTGLTRPTTLAAWAEQLHVLDNVADSLDVFLPQVYERPVDQLVIATAPRVWRREHDEHMGATQRRDLRRTAQDMVRPGSAVADLHTELLKVQQQRRIWERHSPDGGWPRLPEGLAHMRQTEREVRMDIDALAGILASTDEPLTTMDIDRVHDLVTLLAQDSPALRDVPARSALLEELRSQGVGELLDDFALRRVSAAMVGPELELAWWSGVFQEIVAKDPALAGYDGPALGALANRFRDLDSAHTASLAGTIRKAVVDRLREAVYADTEQAAALYHSLGSDGGGHLRATFGQWPQLTWQLRPVRAIDPMLAPQVLSAATEIDLLVLDHPRQLAMAQLAGVVGRATQVVLICDSRAGLTGVAGELAAVLPRLTLTTHRSDVSAQVMGFLSLHGYAEVATVLPTPPGRGRVSFDLVAGEGSTGTPAPGVDAVESPPAEVARVVELVEEHSRQRAEQSLAVVTLSERHAQAIRLALRQRARTNDALHRFLTAERHEHVVAVSALEAAGLHRDRVIVSVGFGKTVHGRVLHQFGPISEPGGRAALIEALGAARHDLIVVSCLGPGEIQSSRVNAPGTQLLADLLDAAGSGSLVPAADPLTTEQLPLAQVDTESDQLVVDLSERLWSLGATVVPRYGLDSPALAKTEVVRIPMAMSVRDQPEELLLAVLTDDPAYVAEPSLRTRDRHTLEALEKRGWRVHRVFSAEMFLDQQRQAQDIADLAHREYRERRTSARPAVPASGGTPETRGPQRDEHKTPSDDASPPAGAGPQRDGGEDDSAERQARQRASAERPAAPAQAPRSAPRRPQPMPRGPRPAITKGKGLANYTDAELDAMVTWIVADALPRTDGQLITELRAHLEIRDTGQAARAVLTRAARRRR